MDESEIIFTFCRGVHDGVLLDVGAHVGNTLAPFAERQWRVHAFEPDPENRAELERHFGSWPNVTILPNGLSDMTGRLVLWKSDASTGASSLQPFTAEHKPHTEVDVITLTDYVRRERLKRVTVLKIDVEGYELRVLRGFPWDDLRPDAVVVEFEDFKTTSLGYDWHDLASFLLERGYAVLVSEWYPVVTYGAAHRWRGFKRYPSELADRNAWGNLLAVPADAFPRLERIARWHARRLRLRARLRRAVRRD